MSTQTEFTEADAEKAMQIWEEYQKTHDVSGLMGKVAAIDPNSGGVWVGENASDVSAQARAEGVGNRILGLRVGSDYYLRELENRL